MNDPIEQQAAALLGAHPGRGMAHLLRLAERLIGANISPEQAVRALIRADQRRYALVAHQFDVVAGTEWRSDPALASVFVPLADDLDVEVETVPAPHVRLLCWRQAEGAPLGPAAAAMLRELREGPPASDARTAVEEIGGALRRWRIGVPFAAGDVMVVGASAQQRDLFRGAAGLGRLVGAASAAAIKEVGALPEGLIRRASFLRSEVRRWHTTIAPLRPDLATDWAQLVGSLAPGWDEPDTNAALTLDDLTGSSTGRVYLGDTSAMSRPSGRAVPLALPAAVAVTALFGLRGLAEIQEVGGVRTARIALRPEVQRRWDDLQRETSGPLAAERRWWALRAAAVLDDPLRPEGWLPGTGAQPPGLPSLTATVTEHGATIAEIPVEQEADGSLLVTGLPDDADIDALIIVLTGRPGLDPDELLANAQRLATLELWAAAAEAYEALCVLLTAAADEPSDEVPPDDRARLLYVLSALRAGACWRRLAASAEARAGNFGAVARQRGRESERAAQSVNAAWAAALSEPAAEPEAAGAGVEMARLRRAVVAHLERLVRDDQDGSLVPDLREIGAELVAIDRLICDFPPAV